MMEKMKFLLVIDTVLSLFKNDKRPFLNDKIVF